MILNEWLVKKTINVDSVKSAISLADKYEVDLKTANRSTVGQNSKQWNFTQYNILSNFIVKELMSEEYQEHFNIKDYKQGSAWMVEGGEGSYHRLHRHIPPENELTRTRPHNKNLACVIYTDVPPMPCGEFYFLLKKEDDIVINVMEDLKPGDMMVMPCTVYHGVYPQGPGKRTTVNIDFYYAGKD
tara:strand:- start:836 stop:1393 length:558 start_codon:yes stop_codon:yes gene_type:complete